MPALYLRISKAEEDEDESNSIGSQRELLWQSLDRYGLSLERVEEYVDDGWSGKNFNRPGIKKLFEDMESGRIRTVLVKDFSRFGRNYREVSRYLEQIFPACGIRFIAVNNGYDSREQGDGFAGTLQNILYDYYSEENSKKIRRALYQMKQEGKYIASAALYGYKKDKEQPYHLVVDEEAAEVVRLIFRMRSEGKSGGEIARYLNGKGIPSPRDYQRGKCGEHIWQAEVIWNMVRNQEYLGNVAAGKFHTLQTGGRSRKLAPIKEQIVTEAMHEAIVDRETFEKAQNRKAAQKRKAEQSVKQPAGKENRELQRKETELSFLKGLVFCGGCGHRMKRKGQKNPFFFCKYYYYDRNPLCVKSGIKEQALLEIIRQVLREKDCDLQEEKLYQEYKKQFQKRQEQQREKERAEQRQLCFTQYFLYERWKEGKISREAYQKEKERKNAGRENTGEEAEIVKESVFLKGLMDNMVAGIAADNTGKIKIHFRMREENKKLIDGSNISAAVKQRRKEEEMKEKKPKEREAVLQRTDNPCCFQYGDYTVELEFSPEGPSFSEVIRQYIKIKLEG